MHEFVKITKIMFEDSDTRNKHVWLIETLSQPRTLKEIQECWKHSEINPYPGTAMTRKTVFNWINKIEEVYGVSIQITRAGANSKYQIVSRPGGDSIRKWLLETISMQNKLITNTSIRDRILLEDVPSAREYLDTVLDAIKQNRMISFDYEDYWEDPVTITMQPYFVKLYRQHWKVIGPLEDGREKGIRSYALDADRLKNLRGWTRGSGIPKTSIPRSLWLTALARPLSLRRLQSRRMSSSSLGRRSTSTSSTLPCTAAKGYCTTVLRMDTPYSPTACIPLMTSIRKSAAMATIWKCSIQTMSAMR